MNFQDGDVLQVDRRDGKGFRNHRGIPNAQSFLIVANDIIGDRSLLPRSSSQVYRIVSASGRVKVTEPLRQLTFSF